VYFVNEYVFHTKEYEKGRKTYNNSFYVMGSTSNEFEVDYYGKLEEVIELQYHNEYNKVFLFKCYWYDTTNKEIIVDSHHSLVDISSKARLGNVCRGATLSGDDGGSLSCLLCEVLCVEKVQESPPSIMVTRNLWSARVWVKDLLCKGKMHHPQCTLPKISCNVV